MALIGFFGLLFLVTLAVLIAGPDSLLRAVGVFTPERAAKAARILRVLAAFSSGAFLLELTRSRWRHPAIFLLGFSLVLLGSGPDLGHDLHLHIFRSGEVLSGLSEGQFNLYLSRGIFEGRGLPVFVYYLSWLYFPAACAGAIGLGFFWGLKFTLWILFLLLGIGMYRFLRLFAGRAAVFPAVFFFLASNYTIGNFLARLALAECFALAVLPYAARYLLKTVRDFRGRYFFLGAGLLALLFICHPLSFINIVPGLMVFVLLVPEEGFAGEGWGKRIGILAVVSGACLALGSFRWIPALLDGRFLYLHHHGFVRFYPEEYLSWRNFLNPLDFRSPGLLQLGCLLWAVRRVFRPGDRCRSGDAVLLGLILIYGLLTTKAGAPVWDHSDLLRANQFSWRMLAPLLFFGAVLFARMCEMVSLSGWRSWLGLTLLLQGLFFLVSRHENFDEGISAPSLPEKVAAYAVKHNGWGIDEFILRPGAFPTLAEREIAGPAPILESRVRGAGESLTPAPISAPGIWEIERHWNPRFVVSVGGEPVPLLASPRGLLAVSLPPGDSRVEILLTKPPYVLIPELVSLAFFVGLVIWALADTRRRL